MHNSYKFVTINSMERFGGGAPERRNMKVIVRAITILALIAIAVGGSALDSDNIIIPTMMILPALAWMVLLIWVNKENLT